MSKFFNEDDVINITCKEIVKNISNQSVYNRLRNSLRNEKDSKWKDASRIISKQDSYSKSIKAVYDYVYILCDISNQGCETGVSPEKRSVQDVKSLENFYKNIGYRHDDSGENWNGPDSADLYDAEENYKLAKKALITIKI